MKKCRVCGVYKLENRENFYAKGARFKSECKLCSKESKRKYTESNYQKIRDRDKEYYYLNKDRIAQRRSDRYYENPSSYNDKKKKWNTANLGLLREYYKKKREDPHYRIAGNLRTRVGIAFKGISKSQSTMELLGCDIEFFIMYISSLFTEGMSIDNYGLWHIDHIRPCCSFDLTDVTQQKICFHYTNLQPLWAKDNFSKGGKF